MFNQGSPCLLAKTAALLMGATACTASVASPFDSPAGAQLLHAEILDADIDNIAAPGPAGASTKQQISALWAKIGILNKHDIAWTLLIDYSYTRFQFDDINVSNADLHRLRLPLQVDWSHGNWQHRLLIAPGIATSSNRFKEPGDWNSSDSRLIGGLRSTKTLSDSTSMVLGILADNRFGDTRLYPVMGIETGDTWSIRAVWPEPRITHRSSATASWYATAYPMGGKWNEVSDTTELESNTMYESWRAGLGLSTTIVPKWVLNVETGVEFERELSIVDRNQIRRDLDLDDNAYFYVALTYRY